MFEGFISDQPPPTDHPVQRIEASIPTVRSCANTAVQGSAIIRADHVPKTSTGRWQRRVWKLVSYSPLASLWNLQGISVREIAKCTWKSIVADRLFGHAAELGFYFLFALFPTLVSGQNDIRTETDPVHGFVCRFTTDSRLEDLIDDGII
jgi:hypothetical protein